MFMNDACANYKVEKVIWVAELIAFLKVEKQVCETWWMTCFCFWVVKDIDFLESEQLLQSLQNMQIWVSELSIF